MIKNNLSAHIFPAPSRDKWERIGIKKRAGVLVPLFSVYSKRSLGIADFADLRLVIDWAKLSGHSIIQLLPMNEIGPAFCPYDSISSFALEPAYLSFGLIPAAKGLSAEIAKVRTAFPSGRPYLDYGIKEEKLRLLRSIYSREQKSSLEFNNFIEANAYWLDDFALFKTLKDYHQGKPWDEWEERYKKRHPQELDDFRQNHQEEIDFQAWVQWQLYQQFREVKRYAGSRNILLKGDLPLLVSRDSADVWAHPEFFKLEFAAGAPPDMYCAKGQRWGMPTYDWDAIARGNYRYLQEKLRYAENFYDILRIDHVIGLFRIWGIPYHQPLENQGLHGFFDPADEKKWESHGRNLLSIILKNTKLLLCAEDLGMIPKSCPKILEELGIPGNDVQRWAKDWKVSHDFLNPQDYRALSVAMLSSHDTTNWPAWWENEVGTVDEQLFMRKCLQYGIDYLRVKSALFDAGLSGHGRLRWLNNIDAPKVLLSVLGKKKEEVPDLVDLYANSYQEKEKLWKQLGLSGPMREKSDREILKAALKLTLGSRAVFCIQLIIDWLYLTDIFKGDCYPYRINAPGTISDKNWSLVIPLPLEELLKNKVIREARGMISASVRI